tara:strand:+ start:881 stop:1087 length:207 start_codon:yes stop_codon:yes gene_type:complete
LKLSNPIALKSLPNQCFNKDKLNETVLDTALRLEKYKLEMFIGHFKKKLAIYMLIVIFTITNPLKGAC